MHPFKNTQNTQGRKISQCFVNIYCVKEQGMLKIAHQKLCNSPLCPLLITLQIVMIAVNYGVDIRKLVGLGVLSLCLMWDTVPLPAA